MFGRSLPWEFQIEPKDGYNVVVYAVVVCVICQVLVRQAALATLGVNHPKRGVAPRLATKVVSVCFNVVLTVGGIRGLLAPDVGVTADPRYGYSNHSQFHFALASGYFLWAAGMSLFYKGSLVAVVQNGLLCGVCFLALHPFMQHLGHIYLLTQASNLVLDLYGCGRLLVRRKSKYLFLSIIHPFVFFSVRLLVGVPVSVIFLLDMVRLLESGKAHHEYIVYFYIASNALLNLLNMYWFYCMVSAQSAGSVISVARGGETMKVKWFAFNLNWFDIGVTLAFGDLQVENRKLKITNSSYKYAQPGLAVPLGVVAAAIGVAKDFRNSDRTVLVKDMLVALGGFLILWACESTGKFRLLAVKKKSFRTMPDDTPFNRVPSVKRLVDEVHLQYHNDPTIVSGGDERLLSRIMSGTPLPKGKSEFSSIHVIAPPEIANSIVAEKIVQSLEQGNSSFVKKELHVHRLLDCSCACPAPSPMEEYTSIFTLASDLILMKADRASLVIFVGWGNGDSDFYAAVIGMIPFRGVSTALITQKPTRGNVFTHRSLSGVFEIDGANAARMGMFPIKAVFGPLDDEAMSQEIGEWPPVDISTFVDHEDPVKHPTMALPFKIGALTLPMLTHNGSYDSAVEAFSSLLSAHYGERYFPIVCCGETCDALGYGRDILKACQQDHSYYFHHLSGETYKSWHIYGTEELFAKIAWAKREGLAVVIIAVGGGVNGNCIGMIAACTNSHLIEVPTTPMHFNDATTSAKKAFSLVKDNKILSKNILGAFYIPELVFCVSETFLTISSANAHATIGESCKTMNMLGMTNTAVGAQDYFNIEGGSEFASDYTKIVQHVEGFDELVNFIKDPQTRKLKAEIIDMGVRIRELSENNAKAAELLNCRMELLRTFRERYYALGETKTKKIKDFLSVTNQEIVSAKAMFLAYSDPFEKYRALLFEYAHTLGHGVEAYLNFAYTIAAKRGVEVPESARRLHGQCVGMAVLWAGQMSFDLGELEGTGFELHQGLIYLFNRHGGFDFMPLRRLFDSLGLTKADFCEGVLEVVRRDNKRGYCACSDDRKSVDQLVTGRLGKMMRSTDLNAELRYLVEVDEAWQEKVLGMAFEGKFDKVADIDENNQLIFLPSSSVTSNQSLTSSSSDVGEFIHLAISQVYSARCAPCGPGRWLDD